MKVAVINYSGSVGKTLVSTYLLAPRLKDAKFFAVETINQSASDLGIENVTSFKGDDFSRLIEDVVFEDRTYRKIQNHDAYLKALYGNYMALPPENQRINHDYYHFYWKEN